MAESRFTIHLMPAVPGAAEPQPISTSHVELQEGYVSAATSYDEVGVADVRAYFPWHRISSVEERLNVG
jgi:hypothetical protein